MLAKSEGPYPNHTKSSNTNNEKTPPAITESPFSHIEIESDSGIFGTHLAINTKSSNTNNGKTPPAITGSPFSQIEIESGSGTFGTHLAINTNWAVSVVSAPIVTKLNLKCLPMSPTQRQRPFETPDGLRYLKEMCVNIGVLDSEDSGGDAALYIGTNLWKKIMQKSQTETLNAVGMAQLEPDEHLPDLPPEDNEETFRRIGSSRLPRSADAAGSSPQTFRIWAEDVDPEPSPNTDSDLITPTESVTVDIEPGECRADVSPTNSLESDKFDPLAGEEIADRLLDMKLHSATPVYPESSAQLEATEEPFLHPASSNQANIGSSTGSLNAGVLTVRQDLFSDDGPIGSNEDDVSDAGDIVMSVCNVLSTTSVDSLPLDPAHAPSPIGHSEESRPGSRVAIQVLESSSLEPLFNSESEALPKPPSITQIQGEVTGILDLLIGSTNGSEPLLRLMSELEHSYTSSFRLDEDLKTSVGDKVKLKVEQLTGNRWNWWPMAAPLQPLKDHEARLSWTCGCGHHRSENVPLKTGLKILDFMGQRATTEGPSIELSTLSSSSQGQKPSNTASSLENSSSAPMAGDAPVTRQTPLDNLSGNSPTLTEAQRESLRDKYIFLLVDNSSLQFHQMSSARLSTQDFADSFRVAYHKLRGFWRYHLSVYSFAYCDFFEFRRYDISGYDDIRPGLPPDDDEEYFYRPRPTKNPRPISKHEWHDIYHVYRRTSARKINATYQPFYLVAQEPWYFPRPVRDLPPLFRRQIEGNLPTHIIPRIPQRYTQFNEHNNDLEEFWGLYAREDISWIMVASYVVLVNAPGLAFFFAYIFGLRGDEVDLQTASVPLTLTLAATAMFFAAWVAVVQLSTREPQSVGGVVAEGIREQIGAPESVSYAHLRGSDSTGRRKTGNVRYRKRGMPSR
ncbi:hypothetical protein CkaCkLH20_06256 [Colletotrichum karsti]|uniref:Uncharacterized protein n=1 Tax=Colletotrichum karsti TaxID=1095194 RepID=A0A9P6LK31_9PEZI|nr:uncharacterized protein CkaCkLH20_06256 [Colletotrichum karsti]KAF9876313.1 hypothetical protein CkaCkLH20_06256 [Colletotrichum karsti]